MNTHQISDFYYLEAPAMPKANGMKTAPLIALTKHYQISCRTQFTRVQVTKFKVQPPKLSSLLLTPPC